MKYLVSVPKSDSVSMHRYYVCMDSYAGHETVMLTDKSISLLFCQRKSRYSVINVFKTSLKGGIMYFEITYINYIISRPAIKFFYETRGPPKMKFPIKT